MGFFWDLIQESKLEEQQKQADSIDGRVVYLEKELKKTKEVLQKTLVALEKHLNVDIDGDGVTGA
jgi:hypothetical protein